MKLFLTFFLSLTSILFSQSKSLTGQITDAKTGLAIPFVNIGVKDTYYGTSSNEFGKFKIVLKSGSQNLLISCVGYKTETLLVSVPHSKGLSIKLNPTTIELPEVIVDGENPAYKIIRSAIANKKKNKAGLINFHYNFYSKNILKSGKKLVFIEEDIGEGFKILPDSVREIKTQLSKTENISETSFSNSDLNFFEKEIIDFSEDSLTLGRFVFHLPISKLAFDYYDYKLLGLAQLDGQNFYRIKVIPYSKIRPTFAGEILIQDSSYALTDINLTLENRNLMPFTEFRMAIIQNMRKYKGYWFPKYYNVDVETNMNYYHLIKLDSAITSYVKVFNNIRVNLRNDNPILKTINQIGDTTFKHEPKLITKIEMDSLRLYPLISKEFTAYHAIDSTKDIVSSLKLGGIGGEYIKDTINKENEHDSSSTIWKSLKYIHAQNNRIDGLLFGLKYHGWINNTIVKVNSNLGYSIARKDIDVKVNLSIPFSTSLFDNVDLTANYGTAPITKLTHYSELYNSFAVTFGFEDQFNYYFSREISIGATKKINKKVIIGLGLTVESQRSVSEHKYYSIFNQKRELRKNLAIFEGMDNKVSFSLNIGSSPYAFDLTTRDGFISQLEYSSNAFESDFDYLKVNLASKFYITTIFDELFFSPYLAILLEANSVFGDYGPQHLSTPQAAMGYYSPSGTFKGLKPYQLLGDKSVSLHLEHNWRKTFFDMLGIYFPVAWNLELTTGISGLAIWNESEFLKTQYKDQFYWEVYGGFSGILGLININVAYNKYKDTVIRFGFSKFL